MGSDTNSGGQDLRPRTKGKWFPKIQPSEGRAEFSVPLDFKYHAASTEELRALDKEIAYAFGSDIDIFSISERDGTPALLYPLIGRPPRYFSLLADYIAAKFPSEAEARACVSHYRHLYLWNMIRLIVSKRIILIISLLVMGTSDAWIKFLGSSTISAPGWLYGVVPGELVGSIVAFLLLWGLTALVAARYQDSHENSSAHVSRVVQQRLSDLSLFFSNTITDIDRAGAHIGRLPDAWNEQSKFLMRLSLYVAKRVEYFERHVQMEMWRIRRLRHWTLFGGVVSLLLVVAASTLTYLIVSPDWRLLIYIPSVAFFSWFSMLYGAVPASAARDAMQPQNWRRYGQLGLDEEIGSQVGRDKRLLAQNAQQNIFQQPSNPPHRSTLSPVGHRSGGSSQRLELVDGYEAGDPVNASQRRYS